MPSENKMNYPNWLNNLFLMFLSNYDRMWAETMPDENSTNFKKMLWLEHLQRFKEDTIMQAGKAVMINCATYPPRIGELVRLCEEFSAKNRSTYAPEPLLELDMPEEQKQENARKAAEAREEIRKLVDIMKISSQRI